ncbi:NAD(P)/FAD-dependent oxidoreductase [Salinarimonas rosea]|uniref:NAD(P)/FAD-dependent oxidoreductase n=1 Tax=Salinarimonas rosea TaxID=552063 RepID=UPI0004043E7B|nr:NAD(P)/FAD-dependent oxidoreductase [Salinarimonas rosea]
MSGARRRVVVVGAGFGGLETAKALADEPVDVVVIDKRNHHCFQPLLYQVATAALSPADIAWPIRGILRGQANATVLMAEVETIDPQARIVRAGGRAIPYDDLVLATGATHSYFGHPEWAQVAPGLKSIEDATALRRAILLAFERAELSDDPAERERLLTFAIVGGGPTGVELAGAIAEVARQALPREFRRIDPREARVVLLEAGPRLLPSFPENLARYAERALARMGVDVAVRTRVVDCRPGAVETVGADGEPGRVPAETIVWAAGVRASPAGRWVAAETDPAGRIRVGPDLSVGGRPEIFAIGDTAAATDDEGRPVPGIAPAAKQMGRYVASVVAARARGRAPPAPFAYRHHGDLATIGRRAAVVKLDRLELKGALGWWFWGFAHVYYLIGLRNRLIVAVQWLWNYLTYQRGARLIVGAAADDAARR